MCVAGSDVHGWVCRAHAGSPSSCTSSRESAFSSARSRSPIAAIKKPGCCLLSYVRSLVCVPALCGCTPSEQRPPDREGRMDGAASRDMEIKAEHIIVTEWLRPAPSRLHSSM